MLNKRYLCNYCLILLLFSVGYLLSYEVLSFLGSGNESLLVRIPRMALVEVNFIVCCLGSSLLLLAALKPKRWELALILALGLVFEYYISGFRQYIGRCYWEQFTLMGPGLLPVCLVYAIVRLCKSCVGGDKEAVVNCLEVLGLSLCMPVYFGASGGLGALKGEIVVYDGRLLAADYALTGTQPAFVISEILRSNAFVDTILSIVYNYLSVWMLLTQALYYFYVHKSQETKRVRFIPMLTYAVVACLGILCYHYFPAVGTKVFCGSAIFPHGPYPEATAALVPVEAPPYFSRNCMPSLHLTWILCAFLPVCNWKRSYFYLGLTLVIATLLSAFSFGSHWMTDFVVALPFTVLCLGLSAIRLDWPKRWGAICWGASASMLLMFMIKNYPQLILRCSTEFTIFVVFADLLSVGFMALLVSGGDKPNINVPKDSLASEG